MKYRLLSTTCEYSKDRISADKVNIGNYISTENMLPNRGGIEIAFSVAEGKSFPAYKEGDILLSNIRPYFKKIWFADRKGGCSNDVLVLKANKSIDKKFLYYVLSDNNFFNYSTVTSKGTKMPRGSKNAIMKYLVPDIDIPTQKRIADILSAYDDLIENNNHRIVLLEKAAQELYKEWFVRFRFPGHETAKFENGLPVGWEIRKIGDIARVKSGYAFKSEWWSDEGVPVIKIKDIQNNTVDFSDLSKVSETHALLARNFFVKEGDLLIAMTGATIGKLAIVPFSDEKLVVNQRVGKFFLGDDPVSTVPFLYCTLQQNWLQELILMVAGSNAAQPNISPFDIEKIKVIYNENVVAAFNKKASDYISQILLLKKKNQNLAKQRDLLLPRLMSGKLEV